MKMTTNWGYRLECSELPDLLNRIEFNTLTANKYLGDERMLAEIKAASNAVRNYCGWHIYPSMPCEFSETMLNGNGRIKVVGADVQIQLPAKFVTKITSVKIGDVEFSSYDIDTNGMLYVFDASCKIDRKAKITVKYVAGVPAPLMKSVKEVISHRVTHALVATNGVSSESAGGVSITYNNAWINSAKASALPNDDKESLSYFKLQGVF